MNPTFILEKFEDQEAAFMGNSQMKLGVNASFFEKKTGYETINYAENGEPLYFTLKKLDKLISKNHDITVLLNIGPLNFYKDHLYNLNEPKNFLEFFSKNIHTLDLKDFKFWFYIHPQEVISGIILSIFKNPIFFEKNEKYEANLELATKNFISDKIKILNKSSLKTLKHEFELQFLKKTLIKYKNNILLIDIPISKIAEDFYLKNEDNEYEKFLMFVNKNKISYYKVRLDLDNKFLFKDLTHLSDKGSILLTDIIIKYLDEKKNN